MTDQELVPYEEQSAPVVVNIPDIPPQFVKPEEFPALDDYEPGISLAPQYKEFEQAGEKVRVLFCGFTSMKNQQGNVIPVAIFQGRDSVWVNAGANLVSQVRTLTPHTPIEITYKGKEKTKGGNTVKTFDVRLLRAKGTAASNGNGHKSHEQAWIDAPSKETWTAFCQSINATADNTAQAFGGKSVSSWMAEDKAKHTPAEAARKLREVAAF